jgi:hypothetical protein
MARRNVKRKQRAVVSLPRPIVGLVIVISSLALCYVWLDCRCDSLCRDIKQLETRKTALTKQYLNEEYLWQQLKSPENVDQALRHWRIPMGWPRPNQIVRMSEDAVSVVGRWDQPAELTKFAQVRRGGGHE